MALRACIAFLTAVTVLGCVPVAAAADEHVALQASFSPDRLGASTTVGFSFQIEGSEGQVPPALEGVTLSLPPGIDYLTTTLGLATCESKVLLAHGPDGCPPNARLGTGSAYVEVPFGIADSYEIPEIQAWMGPPHNGNTVVLFYAEGRYPVYAQVVFPAELVAGTATVGGMLDTAVPLIPSVPAGPPVSIVRVSATIGPSHLTYYEHVHGRTISFHPRGVSVPTRCPRGGFPFAAHFVFADGTSATAKATVPCPHRRRR